MYGFWGAVTWKLRETAVIHMGGAKSVPRQATLQSVRISQNVDRGPCATQSAGVTVTNASS